MLRRSAAAYSEALQRLPHFQHSTPLPLHGQQRRRISQRGSGATSAGLQHRRVAAGTTRRETAGGRPSSTSAAQLNSSRRGSAAASAGTPLGQQPTCRSAAASPQMIGRFNRYRVEYGFFFTACLYLLGEGTTICATLLLHYHYFEFLGDAGSWLSGLGVEEGRYLDIGPCVGGLQLSPRLLLNYIFCSICTYPLFPLQLRLCSVVVPRGRSPWGRWQRDRRTKNVPRAPKAQSS